MQVTHVAIDGSTITIDATAFNPDFPRLERQHLHHQCGHCGVHDELPRLRCGGGSRPKSLPGRVTYTLQGADFGSGIPRSTFPTWAKACGRPTCSISPSGRATGSRSHPPLQRRSPRSHRCLRPLRPSRGRREVHLQPRDPGQVRFAREPSLLRKSRCRSPANPSNDTAGRADGSAMARNGRRRRGTVRRTPPRQPAPGPGRQAQPHAHHATGEDCGKDDLSQIQRMSVDWRTP